MSDDTTPSPGSSSGVPDGSDPTAPPATAAVAGTDGSPAGGSSAAASSTSGSSAAGSSAGARPKGAVRRHWVLVSLAVVLLLLVGSAGGYLYWVHHKLSDIARVHVSTIEENALTPVGATPEKTRALNILLLGADNGADEQSVEADLKDGKWTPFVHRSDTLMIAHVSADRKSVQLVSIPRDTWVPIDGYPYSNGYGKINAAFAFGGPDLATKSVQQLTGIPIDHLAVIDWAGFKDLTSALDGIRVYIPQTFYDESQRITWEKGWHTFKGQEALAYVRTRYGLADGDFGRIERQQNFLRATMSKLLSKTHNLVSVTNVIKVITKYLTIDNTWDNGEIIDLALSLRNIKEADVKFLTAPLGRYGMVDGQSIVRLATKQSKLLFDDVKSDDIGDYLQKYPKAGLSGTRSVS